MFLNNRDIFCILYVFYCISTIFSHFLFLCRCWDLDWQRAGPVFNHGYIFGLCCWLHASTSVCLFFKRLEVSAFGSLSTLLCIHPPLVVGCTCNREFVALSWPNFVVEAPLIPAWTFLHLCWLLWQVHPRVSSVAPLSGKIGRGRGHNKTCC